MHASSHELGLILLTTYKHKILELYLGMSYTSTVEYESSLHTKDT